VCKAFNGLQEDGQRQGQQENAIEKGTCRDKLSDWTHGNTSEFKLSYQQARRDEKHM